MGEKPFFCIFLIGFITFGSFGIIAMLTGVISESMFEKNEMRKEEAKAEHEAMRLALGEHCQELFLRLDVNDNHEASVEDVKTIAPKMVVLIEAAGGIVHHADILKYIENMDTDGGGMIGITEFVSTMEKLAEGLTPLGLQEVHHDLGFVRERVVAL